MRNIEEIIEESQRLIFEKTGKSISFIQKVILRDSLDLNHKTYAQIAVENNYSENYIKQLVAPKLWQQLSEVIGEKVNRTNCRAVLEQYFNSYFLKLQSTVTEEKAILESPEIPVPLNSRFYIERGLEEKCYQEMSQPGAFIRIKAPHKMGKTSLVDRIIAHANFQKYSVVCLSLYRAETELLTSATKFLRWFCANINYQLALELKISDFWDDDIGAFMNCTIYFQEYILKQISNPIVIVLDQVNQLFEYPNLARDFLALLRSWYEETRDISIWQKLRLVLVNSTDVYINLETNRSPFNVGTSIELPAFSKLQVQDLGLRHNLELTPAQLEQLMELTGGFPYLLRLAFYYSLHHQIDIENLFKDAATDTGIFTNYLHKQLWHLKQNPNLSEAFSKVITARAAIILEQEVAFKLKSLGLINLEGRQAIVSCKLYEKYFGAYHTLID